MERANSAKNIRDLATTDSTLSGGTKLDSKNSETSTEVINNELGQIRYIDRSDHSLHARYQIRTGIIDPYETTNNSLSDSSLTVKLSNVEKSQNRSYSPIDTDQPNTNIKQKRIQTRRGNSTKKGSNTLSSVTEIENSTDSSALSFDAARTTDNQQVEGEQTFLAEVFDSTENVTEGGTYNFCKFNLIDFQ